MKKIVFPLIILLVFVFHTSFAYAKGEGTTAAEFLKIGVGARAGAMGEAFTAIADDATSCYWNPAGLAQLKKVELVGMHNWWFVGIRQEHLSLAVPFFGNAIGISGAYVDFGKDDRRDSQGALLGDFMARDILLSISYAKSFFNKVFIGITAKSIQDTIDDDTKKANTGDIGILIKPFDWISCGAVAQNIGGVKIINDPLPYNLKAGIALRIGGLTISSDLNELNKKLKKEEEIKQEELNYNLGLEYWLKEVVAFRGGYKSRHDIGKGITYGLGFNLGFVQFDGAYIPYGDLGDTYRASVRIKF